MYEQTEEGKSQANELRDRNLESLAKIREFIREHRLDFPPAVQKQLGELEHAMTLSMRELSVLDRRVILRVLDRVGEPLVRLQEVVRAKVNE